jgi:hypothetical protein
MTDQNQLLREFVQAADIQDPLFDAEGWIERARAALAAPAQSQGAGEAVNVSFAARVQDLLHLLSFAEITTPTPGDKSEAEKAMADLRHHLRTTQPTSQQAAQPLKLERP